MMVEATAPDKIIKVVLEGKSVPSTEAWGLPVFTWKIEINSGNKTLERASEGIVE